MFLVLESLLIQKLKTILNSNIFLLFFIFLTVTNIIYSVNNVKSKYDINTKQISGIVTHIKKDNNKTVITLKAKENILVYYYNEVNIDLGDKINVKGNFEALNNNTNFNLFNYKKYMLSKNTYYKINATNIEVVQKNNNLFYKIKNYLINKINKTKRSDYIKLFILGDNSYINDKIKNSYSANGISHLFSISGMHITLLSSIILFILNKIKKTKINYIIVILILLFFTFITNFSPSVIRAVLLFILLHFNKLLKLNLSTVKILILICCFVLIINPYNIYNIGFIFSYTISFYLILFSKIINRYKNYFMKILATSFISFLVSIPILINNFFSINLMTIINNIIFVPFVSIFVFPFSLIILIIPKLDFIYAKVILLLENLSLFLCNFKIEIILKYTDIFIIILYYIIITFILYKILSKKYKYIILLIIILIVHANINNIVKYEFITFIDVGQGDSTLMHLNNKNILIDTGGNISYDLSNNIINYLKSVGVKNINYLLLTHGDYDHMGEAINLVENFKVEKVIFNCGSYNDLEKELIKVLDNKKIPYYSCIKELNINDNKIYFLNSKVYDNENDNSSVIYTELNNHKFLFMGDAGVEVEKDLIEKYNLQNIDVLKVGHHGSKTSSGEKFINEINQKYGIISVGKNNRYGHPNKEVLNNLDNSKVYRTDQDGSIMFTIKNSKLKIETCTP